MVLMQLISLLTLSSWWCWQLIHRYRMCLLCSTTQFSYTVPCWPTDKRLTLVSWLDIMLLSPIVPDLWPSVTIRCGPLTNKFKNPWDKGYYYMGSGHFVKPLPVNIVRLQMIVFCFYIPFTPPPNFFLISVVSWCKIGHTVIEDFSPVVQP